MEELTSKPDHWDGQDANCQFLDAWCAALRLLFRDFGSVLSKRPWEIHFLDLQRVFDDLEDFYENNGYITRRDVNMLLREPKPGGLLSPSQSDSRFQLQESAQSAADDYSTDIFLLHDEEHEVYFWGSVHLKLRYLILNVQHSRTRQRLPPSIENVEAGDRTGHLRSCAMSPDGRFIVLLYSITSEEDSGQHPADDDGSSKNALIVIWEINENLDFSRRMNSQVWAGVKYSYFANYETFGLSSKAVTFIDEYCFTPGGRIAMANIDTLPFLIEPAAISGDDAIVDEYFFDGTGNVYISEQEQVADRWRVKMFTPCALNAPNYYSWTEPKWRLLDISTYGRYFVIEKFTT